MNRKGGIALAVLAVLCTGLFIAPSMAKAAAPEVSLQQAVGQDDPTGSSAIDFSLTSNESLVAGSVTTSDFEATNGSVDSITEVGPAEYTIAVTADSDGEVVIAPSATFEVTDLDEAETQSSVSGTDRSVTYDSTSPTVVLEQHADQVDPTNNPALVFSFTSNEGLDEGTVDASDFTVTNGTIDAVTGGGTNFVIDVTASADGEVSIAPSGTFAVTDFVGNETTTADGADRSVFVDSTSADVSLAPASGQVDPTSNPEIEFELTSNEDLVGGSVEATDFAPENGTVTGVSGSGSSYTISVTAIDQTLVTLMISGTFSVTDEFGNDTTSISSSSPTVLYDLAPEVTLEQSLSQNDPTNVSPVEFSLTSNEDLNGATVEQSDFDITGGTFVSIGGSDQDFTITVTPDAEGDVSIAPSATFEVEDTNGNFPTTEAGGTDRTIVYDVTNPVASIDTAPASPSRDGTPTFEFSADEDSSFECRITLDGDTPGGFTSCDSPFTSPFLSAGDYTFEVRATDTAGNVSADESYNWTIEPSGITGGPEDLYFTRGATPVEYRILAEDDQAGALSYEFLNSLGGGTSSEFTVQPDGGTATFTPGEGFAGTDVLTIRVRNTVTDAFTDVTAEVVIRPATRLLTGPAVDVPQLTNDATPTFTYDAHSGPNETAIPGMAFSCRVDNVTQNAADCSDGSFTTAVLAEGEHTFWVRGAKPGINTDPQPQEVTFTVDTIAPDSPTALAGPSGLTNINDAEYTFEIPEGSAECRLISTGDLDPAFEDCTSPKQYTDLADDTYQFEVRTKDNAGNVSAAVANDPLTIDTVVDVTIDVAPVDGNLDGKPAIEFSSSEDPTVTYECRLFETSVAPGEEPAYEACTSPAQLPLLDKNVSYTFQVRGTDEATNTDVATTTWIQSNTAPVLAEPTVTIEAGTTAPVNLGGTDADSDTLIYTITGEVTGGSFGTIDNDTGLVDFTAGEAASGQHTIAYEVTDSRQGGTTSGTITINVQPNTVFIEEPPAETNDVTPTWTFESPSGAATFECSLDSGAWEACDSGSYTPATDLGEGSHDFAVRATVAGLTDPTPATSSTIIDTTAPDATITVTPDALSNETTPAFEFESTDATATFECSIDEGDFAPCVSGDPLDPALADGEHTFEVRAVDPGTNAGTPATYTWEVDATNPVLEITSGPLTDDWTNARRPFWEFTESDLNLVADSTSCQVDAQTVVTDCLSPWQPASNLNDGLHTVTFTVTDGAGNTETVTEEFRVTTITPTVVIDDGPASPSGPSASFAFSSTTDLGVDGKFECRISLNGGTYSPWAECDEDMSLTDLSTGSRTLQVRAVDSAGNHSTGAAVGSWSWNTVGGSPDTAITGQTLNGGSAAFGFNSPGNPLATFECRIDNGTWAACTSPKTYSGLGTGSHTFEARATNQVGTTDGSPASHTWSVAASSAPNTSISRQPAASTTATEATFEFSSSEAVATFECRIDGGAWAACESPKTYTGLSVADHTFDVRSTNQNSLTDQSPASANWSVISPTVDPGNPPVCTPVGPAVSKSKALKLGKKMKLTVQLSHRNAIADQVITAKLLVNGKAPKGKTLKKAKKVLKGVDLTGSSGIVASMTLRKATATFEAGTDTPSNLRVLAKRKKGKALRSSVAFTLQSCDQ